MKIPRHNRAVRFVHWTAALSIFALLFSGFGQMPIYKRYYVDTLAGLSWSSNYAVTLAIHYYAAIALLFISAYYAIYLLFSRRWEIIPRRGDFRESLQIFGALLGLAKEPENDKYLAEQRLAFAVTAFAVLMLIVTGVAKAVKNLPGYQISADAAFWLAQIHNLFTVILFFSIIVHLLAFLIKDNRPLFLTMFTGTIDADYVKRRHRLWWERIRPEEPADDEPEKQ